MGFILRALISAAALAALYQVLHYTLYDAYAVWRHAPTRDNTAGKRVLITGSSKGIGRELAELYSELGAHVTVHGRSLSALNEVSNKCRKSGAASVHAVVGDMSKIGEAEKVVNEAAKAMGGLDIVIVNHIGTYVFETLHLAVSRIRNGQFQRDLQVDLLSYVEATLAAMPLLEKSSGSIVLVSSAAGRLPVPYFYAYGFAKRSLDGLLASVRQELALNGSSVHAGIAVLGAIDTQSAKDILPSVFSGSLHYASVRNTAVAIATVAAGRLRELVTPWSLKPMMMLTSAMSPETSEEHIRQISKRL